MSMWGVCDTGNDPTVSHGQNLSKLTGLDLILSGEFPLKEILNHTDISGQRVAGLLDGGVHLVIELIQSRQRYSSATLTF